MKTRKVNKYKQKKRLSHKKTRKRAMKGGFRSISDILKDAKTDKFNLKLSYIEGQLEKKYEISIDKLCRDKKDIQALLQSTKKDLEKKPSDPKLQVYKSNLDQLDILLEQIKRRLYRNKNREDTECPDSECDEMNKKVLKFNEMIERLLQDVEDLNKFIEALPPISSSANGENLIDGSLKEFSKFFKYNINRNRIYLDYPRTKQENMKNNLVDNIRQHSDKNAVQIINKFYEEIKNRIIEDLALLKKFKENKIDDRLNKKCIDQDLLNKLDDEIGKLNGPQLKPPVPEKNYKLSGDYKKVVRRSQRKPNTPIDDDDRPEEEEEDPRTTKMREMEAAFAAAHAQRQQQQKNENDEFENAINVRNKHAANASGFDYSSPKSSPNTRFRTFPSQGLSIKKSSSNKKAPPPQLTALRKKKPVFKLTRVSPPRVPDLVSGPFTELEFMEEVEEEPGWDYGATRRTRFGGRKKRTKRRS